MKETISITLIIAFACGLILSTAGLNSMSVFAQTNTTKQNTTTAAASSGTNATKASGASAGNSTAQQQQQPSANKSTAATGGKSSTPPTTTTTVKGGPKAAGTASQLNQIEGNNTNIISKGANIANKPGIAGLSGESNVTGK
jgi:cytoskeletal protein RodZ